MRVLTTDEAARRVGVKPRLIQSWVERGRLSPLRPGAKPMCFREEDVIAAHASTLTAKRRAELDALARELDLV